MGSTMKNSTIILFSIFFIFNCASKDSINKTNIKYDEKVNNINYQLDLIKKNVEEIKSHFEYLTDINSKKIEEIKNRLEYLSDINSKKIKEIKILENQIKELDEVIGEIRIELLKLK